jgi:16S rRNA pseudouridine516 synthase
LDKDTTGLILLTNNGTLAHKIISPKSKLAKVYEMTLDHLLTSEDIHLLETGILLEGKKTLPCKINHIKELTYHITLMEGRFHQIKKMMHHVGNEVVTLHRLSIGPLVLDASLPIGSYRPLTKEEITKLSNGL